MIPEIDKQKNKIVKVGFFTNLIFLAISIFYIFYSYKPLLLYLSLINVILLGTYLIVVKYSALFAGLAVTNKIAKGLNMKLKEVC